MAKQQAIEQEGVVTEVLAGGRFRVKLSNEHTVMAYQSGKIKSNRIRILHGDEVLLAISPYDLNKGRIIYRYK